MSCAAARSPTLAGSRANCARSFRRVGSLRAVKCRSSAESYLDIWLTIGDPACVSIKEAGSARYIRVPILSTQRIGPVTGI